MKSTPSSSRDVTALRRKAKKRFEEQAKKLTALSTPKVHEFIRAIGTQQIELEVRNGKLRAAQRELKALCKKHKELYDDAPVGYVTVDDQGVIHEANLVAAELLGIEKRRLINKPFISFIATPEDVARFHTYSKKLSKTHAPGSCEIRLKRNNQPDFYALLHCRTMTASNGRNRHVRGAIIDITESKHAEKELDQLFSYSIDMLCVVGFDGHFKRVNPSFERTLGWKADELVSTPFTAILHPDDHEATKKAVQEHKAGKESLHFENRYRCKDGSYKWISWNAHPRIEEELIVGVGRDITERKQMEEALRENEERYHQMFNNMSSGVAVYKAVDGGADFIFKEFNPAAERATKSHRSDVLGRRVSEIFPDVKHFGLFDVFQRVWRSGVPESHPSTLYHDAKVTFWAENQVYKLPSGEIVAIFDDITKRKQTEDALRDSEERYRSFVQHFQGIAFRGTFDYKPIFFHGMVEQITGYTEEEFVSGKLRWDQLFLPDDFAKLQEGIKKMHSVPDYSGEREYRIRRKDGQIRWVHEMARSVCDSSGSPRYLQGALYDITERKQLEEEREKLILDWQEALSRVKTLSGLLPICAWCKKVRNDEGYWQQVESYIAEHSDLLFSHGICPECFEKAREDYQEPKKEK